MKAILRGIAVLLVGAVWLTPAAALAQETQESPPTTSSTPSSDAVGPRELQNFSLPGSVTRPNDQQTPAPAPAKPSPASAPSEAASSTPPVAHRVVQTREQPRHAATTVPAAVSQPTIAQPTQPSPASALISPAQPAPAAAGQPSPASTSLPSMPTAGLAAEHGLPFLPFVPWLLAALALAGGTAFMLWRRRPREALAGVPQFDLFTAPEPELAPAPAPDPVPVRPPPALKPKASAASGIVASRLRPSIELGVHPLRCVVEDNQVVIEFEVELFNSGTAPARAVLAEASLLNAGETQEKELITFFANPVGAGERLDSIAPMRRVNFASRVIAPRSAIQEYEVAGRKAFVPVIAFNALYEWSGGKAQTSVAYLVGRETRGEKLGPLHLDLGPRAFTSLGARTLPATVRT
jgi:hypothetical protein